MKRFLSGLWAAALGLTLCACGGGKAPQPFDPAADTQTLLSTTGLFSEALTGVDKPTACMLYGIDEDLVTDCAVYASTGATAEELAIFSLASEEDAQTVATALGYRVEDRIEGLRDYLPDEISKLENAVIKTQGASVLLVVAADYAGLADFLGE